MHVVDAADHGLGAARLGQQREGGQAHEESVGRRPGLAPERDAQGVALPRRDSLVAVEERQQREVHRRERQLRLGLDTGQSHDPHTIRGGHVVEQRRLADAGLADEHERAAHAVARRRHECVERVPLGCAAEQGNRVLRDDPHASGTRRDVG